MTRIVTDTTCGLPFETTQRLGIPMVSQIINFGEDSYREGPEIDYATFMQRLRTGRELPKTAAPYPGDFIEVFRELVDRGDRSGDRSGSIVCIHPSIDVSGTVRSAETAREAFPDADIRVIDTRSIAGPLSIMVLEADRLAKAGATADEIEAAVHAMMARARIYFLVDTLEFLRRGGRIGGAAALVGSLLQVKPILAFRGGRVEQFEKERTKKRALARVTEVVVGEAARGDDAHLIVMHAEAQQEAEGLAATLAAALGCAEVPVMDMIPAIVTHVGPGVLAVGFFTAR